jgi:hypothetical protein
MNAILYIFGILSTLIFMIVFLVLFVATLDYIFRKKHLEINSINLKKRDDLLPRSIEKY